MKSGLSLTCIGLLKDMKCCLEQIDTIDYRQPLNLLFGSSVGQHARHILDGFTCLFQQLENKSCVNYELRKREVSLETNTAVALDCIADLIERLSQIDENDYSISLVVNYNTSDSVSHFVNSTFQRELAYNIEHAIHHMAIIKIALNHYFPKTTLPEHFGVAPSTIRYRKGIKAENNIEVPEIENTIF